MRPPLRFDSPFDRRIVYKKIFIPHQLVPPVRLQHMAEIEKDTAVFRIIVRIFMETDAIRAG